MLATRACVSCLPLRTSSRRIIVKCYATGSKTATASDAADSRKSGGGSSDIIPKSEIDPVSGLPFRKLELIPVKAADDSYVEEIQRPYDRVVRLRLVILGLDGIS